MRATLVSRTRANSISSARYRPIVKAYVRKWGKEKESEFKKLVYARARFKHYCVINLIFISIYYFFDNKF